MWLQTGFVQQPARSRLKRIHHKFRITFRFDYDVDMSRSNVGSEQPPVVMRTGLHNSFEHDIPLRSCQMIWWLR